MSMARALGMDVVAEGWKKAIRRRFSKTLGCEYAQGYLYGKPVASEDAEKLIALPTGNRPLHWPPCDS